MSETDTEPQESGTTSLVVVEKSDALTVFKDGSRINELVEQVRQLAKATQHDASTAVGRAEIKALAYKVKRSKTYIDAVGKELVDDLKALPKLIDANRKIARDALDTLHDEIRKPLTDWEAEQDRIKKEKLAAERAAQERTADVQRAITGYTQAPLDAIGKDHTTIQAILDGLEEHAPEAEFFGERHDEATAAWSDAITKLHHMAEQAEAIEAQERIERERLVAEEAARREREAAEQKILQAKMDAERAERDRQAAEQRAKDAEAARVRDQEAAVRREEQARQQAAEAERRRIEAEQEATRQAEAKRAADIEHRKKINNGAVSCLMTHAGLTLPQAREVVVAISRGNVSNVTISY